MAADLAKTGDRVIPAELLAHIPGGASGRPVRDMHLLAGGGQLNRCVAVTTDEGRFVLRLRVTPGERPGASPAQELRCHLAAASLGIAPGIAAAAPDGAWIVMDYVDAPAWRVADLQTPERLESLGQQLAALHALSPSGVPSLDVCGIVEAQAAVIQQRNPDSSEGLRRLQAHARFLSDEIAGHKTRTVLCHGDLSVSNFLGPQPLMVDWEYAQCADPVYDVACLLSYYPTLQPLLDRLLGAAALDDAASRERLGLYRQVFDVFNALWLEAQGADHGDAAGLVRRPSAQ